jgi:predicted RNase H-like nuclease (RuvC/YqgF family)
MNEMITDNKEKIVRINEKIEEILVQYRLKHDELELATEEWDIGEIQEDLSNYTKEINKLKRQIHNLKSVA